MANEVRYADVFKAGYKVTPVTQSNSSETADANKVNIRLEREDVDYTEFFNNCLVSVNGFYHMLDTDGYNGLLVLDAMKSLNISKQNQLGILSFKEIGEIDRHYITDSMITSYPDDNPEVGTVRITLPFSTVNKTVIFCLGGYLRFVGNEHITRVADQIYKINFNTIPFLDVYYESKKYLDLSSLPLEHGVFNQEQISLEQLISRENLKAYLKLKQSFIIVVDTPLIQTSKYMVKKTGSPGMYIGYKAPAHPLVTGFGRHPEYWVRVEDGQYAINIHDNVVDNRLYDTLVKDNLESTDNSRRPDYPGEYADAYLLKIFTD